MNLTFLGAAHEVTGSFILLTVNGKNVVVDCGMEQGRDIFVNQSLPVDASMVDCVLLTHAHIDHSGNLPLLYKNGFRGSIYATETTCQLCNIMLRDSAHIQETEAEWKTRKAQRAGDPPVEPVYDMEDAIGTIGLLVPCRYGRKLDVFPGLSIRFVDIGHLLGSSAIEVWLSEDGQERKIVFSGDVGNHSQPLLKDPNTVKETDYLVIESTYGDRVHEQRQDPLPRLASIIQRTFDRGGNVVIPSFAVGRTQEMLYFIRQIKQERMVRGHDGFAVYVDSPLANEATKIFVECDPAIFDDEARQLIAEGVNPIWFPDLKLSHTQYDSKAINEIKEPKVIIAASGMCEAGRIRHHLKHNLWRPESTILFVGFQSPGTLGRNLADGERSVKIFGESISVKAEIAQLQGVSGHADMEGLIGWVNAFERKPSVVFVNHGEDKVTDSFAKSLHDAFGFRTYAPYSGASFDLISGEPVRLTVGVPVEKKKYEQQAAKKKASPQHQKLMTAANALLQMAQQSSELANGELNKLTEQINQLLSKWK